MWRIIGQDRAVSLLRSSLEKASISHAYLFTGPPHIGKMTMALELAQALNCESAEPPCGECNSCRKIKREKHADVQIIGLLTNGDNGSDKSKAEIGIEQIRQLQHSANLPPFEGKCKVFIIDGANYMTIEAANCLLKTLEEPESRVVIILLADKSGLIPETVISRCQWLKLSAVAHEKVQESLGSQWGTEPQKAQLLSRLCKGCIGWAISAVENEELLVDHCEMRNRIHDIIYGSNEERFAYATKLATQFSKKKDAVHGELGGWLDLWRDALLMKVGSGESIINIDFEDNLRQWAEEYSLYEIRKFISDIQEAGEQLRQNASPRLVLEVMMLNIPARKRERIAI